MSFPRTKTELCELLEREGLAVHARSLGQCFLIDEAMRRVIVEAGALRPGDRVLEIGAGPGLLTGHLLEAGARVLAVEIDAGWCRVLERLGREHARLTLLEGDALDGKRGLNPALMSALRQIADEEPGAPLKIIANIPYQISTPLLVTLCEASGGFERMVVTVQREVASRLRAEPGSADWGLLGLLVGHFARVERLRDLPPSVFWPQPRVHSTLVRLVPRQGVVLADAGYASLKALARACFQHRRKTLRKTARLYGWDPVAFNHALAQGGLDDGARFEELSRGQISVLAEYWPAFEKARPRTP